MNHWTLREKYNLIKDVCTNESWISSVGIHNFGLLHDIADRLGMKGNSGGNLHSLWTRVTKIMRELIKAGYPIEDRKCKKLYNTKYCRSDNCG